MKEKSGAKYLELVGYSGGGAIAVLVAARRSDVVGIRTVAGNLDTRAFCKYQHVSALDGSMNPLAIAESFVRIEGDKNYERITVVDGVSRNDGWHKHWRELLLMQLL